MDLLPNEICREIFAKLEHNIPETWRTEVVQLDPPPLNALASVSLTCRRFNHLAKPLLYKTIAIEAYDDKEERFVQFARTLVLNPQLGLGIRTITLKDGHHHGKYDFGDALEQTWLSLDAPMSFKKRVGEELADRAMIGLVPLILALTPLVKLVDYTHGEEGQCTPWILSGRPDLEVHTTGEVFRTLTEDEVQALNARSPAHESYTHYGLPKLEEVRIGTGDHTYGNTPIHTLEPVLLHPNLNTLRLHRVNWLGGSISQLKFLNEPCNLECLDLKDCALDHSSLRNILTRCKKLKWLSMETADKGRRGVHDDGSWDIDLDEFRAVLEERGQSLEFFDLHIHESMFCAGYLGSLRGLGGLLRLRVGLTDIMEIKEKQIARLAEALPPAIETLHLYWNGDYYDNPKRVYDNTRRAVFRLLVAMDLVSNLRRVSIDRYGQEQEDIYREWEKGVEGWDIEIRQECFCFRRQFDGANLSNQLVSISE
ncbi:F-box domain-containing protein [Fusarium sp. Ph1]|nr:F-box domain-containing protein [Fusarium sp. Ph1]